MSMYVLGADTKLFKRGKQAMSHCGPSSSRSHINQGEAQFAFGDVIWVRYHESWWPGQIFDENTVSVDRKPRKTSSGDVLVRLYGSYEYLYVDPVKSCAEFENMLQENNSSSRRIIEEAMDLSLSRARHARLKGKQPQRRGQNRRDTFEGKRSNDSGNGRKEKSDASGRKNDADVRMTRSRKASLSAENPSASVSPRSQQKTSAPQAKGRSSSRTTTRQLDGKKYKPRSQTQSPGAKETMSEPPRRHQAAVGGAAAEGTNTEPSEKHKSQRTSSGTKETSSGPSEDHQIRRSQRASPLKAKMSAQDDEASKSLKRKRTGTGGAGPSNQERSPRQEKVQKKRKHSEASSSGESQALGKRKTKVMQNLGLSAPDGSPYQRKGCN